MWLEDALNRIEKIIGENTFDLRKGNPDLDLTLGKR